MITSEPEPKVLSSFLQRVYILGKKYDPPLFPLLLKLEEKKK